MQIARKWCRNMKLRIGLWVYWENDWGNENTWDEAEEKICSNLFKYNAGGTWWVGGISVLTYGQRMSVCRISECHPPSGTATSHCQGQWSQATVCWCLQLCPAKSSAPLQVLETLPRPLPGTWHISPGSGSLPTAAASAGASICSCSCHFSGFLLGKPQFWQLCLQIISHRLLRGISAEITECELPQWNVAAVCSDSKTCACILLLQTHSLSLRENKACLAVRIANSGWHLKTELCSPSIITHP